MLTTDIYDCFPFGAGGARKVMPSGLPKRRRTGSIPPPKAAVIDVGNIGSTPTSALDFDIVYNRDRYDVRVSGVGFRKQCICDFTDHDLASNYQSISKSVEGIFRNTNDDLYELADRGYHMFKAIFPDKEIREKIRSVLTPYVTESLSERSRTEIPLIVVHSQRFSIPWPFLYLERPDSDSITMHHFLGYRCIITSNIEPLEKGIDWNDPRIHHKVNVLGGFCSTLKWSQKYEIPFIKRLVGKFGDSASYMPFPILYKNRHGRRNPKADSEARRALFSSDVSIVHLACHGFNHQDDDQNYLQINDAYPFVHTALDTQGHRFKRKPIVFLNACEMGFIDPLKFTSIVREFLAGGARAVLAPNCKVSDLNSARFSIAVYKHLGRGKCLMEAVFRARHESLRRRDLIGFAYSLYGEPHGEFSQEKKK